MADLIDIDNLSDDELMKLSDAEINAAAPPQEGADEPNEDPNAYDDSNEDTGATENQGNGDGGLNDAESDEDPEAAALKDGPNEDPNEPAGEVDPTPAPMSNTISNNTDEDDDEADGAEPDPQKSAEPKATDGEPAPKTDATKNPINPKENKGPEADAKKAASDGAVDSATPEFVMDFHKKITAPFKANGRDFTVKSAEDAVRLMQQGINYSTKMHQLKPLKRMARMLEENDLMDEAKLNNLIDLSKKDPAAIRQLVKDSGIDPLDLDDAELPAYKANNYNVTDKAVAFQENIEETLQTPEGKAFISSVHQDWDAESKEALRDNPEIFDVFRGHREAGVYEKIKSELEYQRSVDPSLANTPYLQAYHKVGDLMNKAGAFEPEPAPTTSTPAEVQNQQANPTPNPNVLGTGTRKAATSKTVQPNPKVASIIAPGGRRPAPKPQEPNYDDLDDDEFLKRFGDS